MKKFHFEEIKKDCPIAEKRSGGTYVCKAQPVDANVVAGGAVIISFEVCNEDICPMLFWIKQLQTTTLSLTS